MLRKQYQCNLEGFVDLRNLAVTKTAYGKVLLKKLQKFEEELAILFPEDNEDVKFFLVFSNSGYILFETVVITCTE